MAGKRRLLFGLVALTAFVGSQAVAAAAPRKSAPIEGVDFVNPERPHCVTTLYSAQEVGARQAKMRTAKCYATFDEAQEAAKAVDTHPTADQMRTESFGFQAIGIFCDGLCGQGGSTLTVNGTDCGGGGLVFSDAWDDRVDENWHKKCYEIDLWATESYTGGCATFGTFDTTRTPCISLVNSNEAVTFWGPEN